VVQAKKQATREGQAEWKRKVTEGPPVLPPEYRDAAGQLYLTLANALGGRRWFSEAWAIDELVSKLRAIQARGGGSE
jgi:hypothetical protein